MSTPFKMNMPSYGQGKNPIQMSESPAKKKVVTKSDDGGTQTVKTRKNLFTGRTRKKVITRDKDGNVTNKYKEVKRKDGTKLRTKHKMSYINRDDNKTTLVSKSKKNKQGVAVKDKYVEKVTDKHGKTTKTVTKVKGKKGTDRMS